MPAMKIFNLHTNDERNVEDVKVVAYDEYDKNGRIRTNRYVQYTVLGNPGSNRAWTDFMPVKNFKKLNPNITVEGLNS